MFGILLMINHNFSQNVGRLHSALFLGVVGPRIDCAGTFEIRSVMLPSTTPADVLHGSHRTLRTIFCAVLFHVQGARLSLDPSVAL